MSTSNPAEARVFPVAALPYISELVDDFCMKPTGPEELGVGRFCGLDCVERPRVLFEALCTGELVVLCDDDLSDFDI